MKNPLRLITIYCCCLLSMNASANHNAQVMQCAQLSEASERLACYDSIAERLLSNQTTKASLPVGGWSTRTEPSASGTLTNVHLSLLATMPVQTQDDTIHPELFIVCDSSKTGVSLNFGTYLGIGSIRIKTYFDNHSNRSKIWTIAEDNETVLLSGSDISFIKKMMKHEKLVTEVTPFGQQPVTAEFDISGLAQAVIPVRKACKW